MIASIVEGDYYNNDYKEILSKVLQPAIDKYKLKLIKNEKYTQYYANEYCIINIWVAGKYRILWNFLNIKSKSNYEYLIMFYTEFILGIKKHDINYYKTHIKQEAGFTGLVEWNSNIINYELLTYIERPMKGDFSWHAEYKQKLLRYEKLISFIDDSVQADVEKFQLACDYYDKKATLEDVEKLFYKRFPNGGKEYEPDPNSIPDE